MKRFRVFMALVLIFSGLILAQTSPEFDDYFIDSTMRIDYYHVGDAREEFITLDRVYKQGIWAGSKKELIDNFDNGRYYVKIYHAASKRLIFSKGFDSYFGEYKTTNPALKGIKRTYHESVLIPFPKEKIIFVLESRSLLNRLDPIFSQEIDPRDFFIIEESFGRGVRVFTAVYSGDPHQKVDMAFIGEGYSIKEAKKFRSDVKRCVKVLFKYEPYKSFQDKFNIYGVLKPSEESGSDEPTHGMFKNTSLNSSFNSLGSMRYLLTEDNKSLRDVAAHVPYDTLFIIVNHKRYGGGGIYNLYCTFTVDNQWHEYLMIHELGHSFAGLADEYYSSSVAYNEFYPQGVEPKEPNITALLDPENLKWKELVSPGVKIPTPWEKEGFDRMDEAYQKLRRDLNERIARLKREQAPEKEVKKLEKEAALLSFKHSRSIEDYLGKSRFSGLVGAFEGAGYSSRGLYRPEVNCIMFTRSAGRYCAVCQKAIIQLINHYCADDD